MQLKTLGGLDLVGGRVARRKPLLLCVYLALEGPQERRQLARLFWNRTVDPAANLRVALSQLRAASPELAQDDGTRVWTDVITDAQHVIAALERGVVEPLDSVRGRFLDGIDGLDLGSELEEWVAETRSFVSARVHRGLVTLAERRLARGDHDYARDVLERSLSVVPLDEIDPDDLPRLHALLHASGSIESTRLATLAGEYGVSLAGLDERIDRIRAGGVDPSIATNLTNASTRFVGRAKELAALMAVLDEPDARLVTLLGVSGTGKTRLALEVARRCLDAARHTDGIFFVDLSTTHAVQAVPDAIARSIGIGVVAGAAIDQLVAAVQDRRVLIVLDNCEHLAGVGAMAATLVSSCAGVQVVATSRERLGASCEWVVPVEGLQLPDDAATEAETILTSDAARLFIARCTRYTGVRPHARSASAVARICHALVGNPLALELAAPWTRVLDLAALAEELERDLRLLDTAPEDLPDRQRGLRAAFEYSWSLLGEPERRALRRLSVFRGGFERDAANAVTELSLPALKRLIDASLVTPSEGGRYERHPLLASYAEERLAADEGERSRTETRHAEVMLELVRDLYPRVIEGGSASEAFARLRREEANVHAAVRTALTRGLWDHLARALPCIASYAEFQARYHFGHAVAHEVVGRLPPEPEHPELRAMAHAVRGFCMFRAGDPDRVEADGREALHVLDSTSTGRSEGEGRVEARWWAHHCLAMAGKVRGDARACVEHALEALALVDRAHPADAPERSSVLAVMAGINHHVACLGSVVGGDVATAVTHDRASREHLQRVLSHADAYGAQTTALLRLLDGDPEGAARSAHDGLAMSRPVGYGTATANLLEVLARSELARGDLATAAATCDEALRVTRDVGDVWLGTSLRALRGTLHAHAGRFREAATWYERSFELAERHSLVGYGMEAVVGRAEVAAARGDGRLAAALLHYASEYPRAPFWIRDAAAHRLVTLAVDGYEALTPELVRAAMLSA